MNQRVREVIEQCQAFIADKDDALSLPPESAQFVCARVLAARARRCLEIGTSSGHSGLWIAAAAAQNGGTLVSIDREARKTAIAVDFFRQAGLGDVTSVRTGPAGDVLARLEGTFDFVLNDADKESYVRYVEMLYPQLPVGPARAQRQRAERRAGPRAVRALGAGDIPGFSRRSCPSGMGWRCR